MLPRIICFGISFLCSSLLLTLCQSSLSDAVAQGSPRPASPSAIARISPQALQNLFVEHPGWLKFKVRSAGALTTTIKLPEYSIDPFCSLHLEFSADRSFLASLGEFSMGATNFTRGTFSTRMRTLPEVTPGKSIRRIFARGVLLCPSTANLSGANPIEALAISKSLTISLSRARINKKTSLNAFTKSFLLGKFRRSAYKARPRFQVYPLPEPDENKTSPLITRQTDKISVDPSLAYDIVAYAMTSGTPPLEYSWHLIESNVSDEIDLGNRKGVGIISDATGSMLIAYGDTSKLIGKSLRVTVRNRFGEIAGNLIPITAAAISTSTPTPSPSRTLIPAFTASITPNPTLTSTPYMSPTPTSTPTPTATATSTPLQYGFDSRPVNNTCRAPNRNNGDAPFDVARVFPALTFNQPVKIAQAPNDSSRFYVAEQAGVIRSFPNTSSVSAAQVSQFLDMRSKVNYQAETGLMGFAFHPDWPDTPLVFVSYVGGNLESRLSSFETTDGGKTLDINSEQRILTVTQPYPQHTIDDIQFGNDGLLYISLGDGHLPPENAGQNSQNSGSLLGKILRIDIDGTTGSANYRIPVSNPYYSSGTLCGVTNGSSTTQPCAEVFAMGFRNPWRFSLDPDTNELWVADVGQSTIEEVNKVSAGGNYGWPCQEGTLSAVSNCNQPPNSTLLPPIAQYSHTDGGFAITGGYVYRGNAIPALTGRYIFADYVSRNIWSIPRSTSPTTTVTGNDAFSSPVNNVVSFGIDQNRELYLLDYSGGGTYKVIPSSNQTSPGVASRLSATGCVDPTDPTQPASGLIPFEPISPLWSDGAQKDRWLALPQGGTIRIASSGDFQFPLGTVLMKNFQLNNKLIETRLLMLHPDGVWAGYSYRWNDQQTDATLLSNGLDATIQGQTWTFPSSSQCMACHTQAAGRSLGPESLQLNSDFLYPQTGRVANQLRTMNRINLFNPALSSDPASQPALTRPQGTTGTLNQRARSYLHANCSHCHRPGGGTPVNLDLRYSTTLPNTNTCNQPPQAGSLGIVNARIISPGTPARSVLVSRMNRRDVFQMPPLGTHVVDDDGVALMTNWIRSLPNCN